MQTLSIELYWLTLTTLMTSLFWIPYIINRMLEQGILYAIWDPSGNTDTRKPWANRMMCAHQNAVENLVIFAPLVILIELSNSGNEITETACLIYFIARIIHFFAYSFAVPVLRVITFLCGFAAQLSLAGTLLKLI